MAQQTPLFPCNIEPIEQECTHKYGVELDNTFLDFQHLVNACLFPSSKIFDSRGNIHELQDLLHDRRVGYDWQKVAPLYLDILADKYCEAGDFLESAVIPVELKFNPHQLVALEISSHNGVKKSLHEIRNYGALLSFMDFTLHDFDHIYPHIALYAWPTNE